MKLLKANEIGLPQNIMQKEKWVSQQTEALDKKESYPQK